MGLIEREDGEYKLTPYGQAVRSNIKESLEFYSTYEKYKKFWETHKTTGIPDYLWKRLGELNGSILVEDTLINVTESHDKYLDMVSSIKKRFYGVSPIYHREYVRVVATALENNVDSKFVISQEILSRIASLPVKLLSMAKMYWNRAEWFIYEGHLPVAFTVSECFLSLALDKIDGTIDVNADLVSTKPRAIKWGMDLFEYYKKRSKPVKLADYL